MQVVSNNNSATNNIYEKLSSSKYNLGFIVAKLGNLENKIKFLEKQNEKYPNFSSWELNGDFNNLEKEISEKSAKLKKIFDKQERLAILKQELKEINIEFKHFKKYIEELKYNII